jgi:outer membrane receptor for ferric coprogen and ferric-rhodotorulic acid
VDRDGAGPLAPETHYRAAKGAKSEGFEFDVAGELARGWNASAGYTQYRARDAAGADINSVYPRKLFRVFTTYRLPGSWRRADHRRRRELGRPYLHSRSGAPANTNGPIEQEASAS